MPRLYRVRYRVPNEDDRTLMYGIPSDAADALMEHLLTAEAIEAYGWIRVWIETMDGTLVHEVKRSGV